MTDLEFKAMFKGILALSNHSIKELAELNGLNANGLQQKIGRGSIKFIEFANLMESIGYKVKIEKIESDSTK